MAGDYEVEVRRDIRQLWMRVEGVDSGIFVSVSGLYKPSEDSPNSAREFILSLANHVDASVYHRLDLAVPNRTEGADVILDLVEFHVGYFPGWSEEVSITLHAGTKPFAEKIKFTLSKVDGALYAKATVGINEIDPEVGEGSEAT